MNTKKTATIFIVEDDAVLAMDLRQTLEGFGYKVLGSAASGEEALTRIAAEKPELVVMDITLSGKLDGVQTAEQLAHTSAVPVLFLTGITQEETLQRAKLTQPCGYLIKPFDPIELRAAIELGLYRASAGTQHEPTADELRERELEHILESVGGEDSAPKRQQVLSRVSLFSGVEKAGLEKLGLQSRLRQCAAGEFIFHEGEARSGGFIVLSGKIAITRTSASGKTLILALLSAGDADGLFFLVKDFVGSCSARAQIDSRILWISEAVFLEISERNAQVSKALVEQLAAALVRSFELASGLAHSRVESRIINTLLTLVPKQNGLATASAVGGRIFMTRKDLADLTGTTPETAIRVTKNLERAGLLDLTRPGIIKLLNLTGLRAAIQD